MTSARTVDLRRRRRVAASGLAGLSALVLTSCSVADMPNQISIPDPKSDHADRMFHLWQGTWLALWIIGAITWALMLGAAWFYRRRREDDVPKQTRYNVPIEVLYTVTPLIVIAVFAVFTIRDSEIITEVKNDQAQTINVVGYQWNWAFNYTDEGVYESGSPSDLPTLYLPVDQKVQFVLTSPDVIHSFWIPSFLMKMDVVPGRANRFEVTPTEVGRFHGKCAEMCGTYHSQMLFWVEVVDQETFDAKMDELRAAGQTGQLDTERPNTDAQNQGNTRIGDLT